MKLLEESLISSNVLKQTFQLIFLLFVVFLNSQQASQVLVRHRRANQMFEEMKPGDFLFFFLLNQPDSGLLGSKMFY